METVPKNNKITYWAKVVILGLVLGFGLQLVSAWSGPSATAPGGNVAGPLTTSSISQTKTGNLILGRDLAVSRNAVLGSYVSTSNTSGLCLSGVCHRTWASVLAGVGGGVTSITAGNGINVNSSTGAVTVSANTSILQTRVTGTCPAGQSIRAIAANGSVTCEVDDTADISNLQNRITGTCPSGQSIRAIAANGSVTCEADDTGTSGVTSISAGSGISINRTSGDVTISSTGTEIDTDALLSEMFSGATTHTCDLYSSQGSQKTCAIGTKNMCFLVNVFGRDGDDVDGFGCSVIGSPGGSWSLRAVGEDFDRTYCQAKCI